MLTGILSFLLHVVAGLVFIFVGREIFKFMTPQDENKLIKEGNHSASIVLNAKVLGLAIVIASSIKNSVDIVDMLIWSAIAIVAQVLTYKIHDLLTPKLNFKEEVEKNNIAVALKIATISVVVGMIIAASMTY